MTHPLHGVHGRQNRFPDRVGTVVHVTEGTSEAPAFLYLMLDEPMADGKVMLIIRSTDFVPTDPAALRQRLTPRDHIAEARAAGDAFAARLLGSSTLSGAIRDAAVATVYAALGESPPTKLADLADRIGKAVRS